MSETEEKPVKRKRTSKKKEAVEVDYGSLKRHDVLDPSPLDLEYNARYREDTEADLGLLDVWYRGCLSKFNLLYSSSDLCIYKTLHYLHGLGLRKEQVKTLSGQALETYLDYSGSNKSNIMSIRNMRHDGILKDVNGKIVAIFGMTSRWTPSMVYLFYNELKCAGAYALIFHSSGARNFGEVMIEDTSLKVLQFPEEVYDGHKVIANDKW